MSSALTNSLRGSIGRVALITGSAKGIGRAIALRLADDGFDVTINDITAETDQLNSLKKEIETKGRKCITAIGDVSQEPQVMNIVEKTVTGLGKLDVMVANAGTISVKPMRETNAEEWDRVQNVNVRGMFLCYKYAGIQMIRQGNGGKIIGACSISGFRPAVHTPAYSVSKWAIRGLTQVAALDLAPHGITVNAYCPGTVRTDMWEEIDCTLSERFGVAKGVPFATSIQERTALKRAQTVEDVAGLVSFLAGKDSNQITGQSLIVDGGTCFS